MSSIPVLAMPKFCKTLTKKHDASGQEIREILTQKEDYWFLKANNSREKTWWNQRVVEIEAILHAIKNDDSVSLGEH